MPSEPACLAEVFLEQSLACHWLLDAGGVFVQIYGNPAPLFGKAAMALAGQRFTDALSADQAEIWAGRFARVLAGESVALRERRGQSAWSIVLFPVRLHGEIQYAGGSAREATSWAAAEQELRHTVLGAMRAQEFQRNSASRFLHDSVGQNLTALGLQLDLVRMDLEAQPVNAKQIADVQKLLEQIVEEVREFSYELNPSTVERAGLRAALDRLPARFRSRYTGALRINVDPSLKVDSKIAVAMYHIALEAIENAVQHAGCSAIEIALKSTRVGPRLEIRDNGRGFDPADLGNGSRGLGLLSMEHYAAQAGMDLNIRSGAAGTAITLDSPGRERGGA